MARSMLSAMGPDDISAHLAPELNASSNALPKTPGSEFLEGSLKLGFAQLVTLTSGFLTAFFLTRWLEPNGYGLYSLAVNLVIFVEQIIMAMFLRPSIKHVADAHDPIPVAATVIRLFACLGFGGAVAVALSANSLSKLFSEPGISTLLPLLAIEIALSSWSQGHIGILMGLGKYDQPALLGAIRWCTRLVLVVSLVAAGFSVEGAVLGCVLASLVEAILCRYMLCVPIFTASPMPVRAFFATTGALTFAGLAARLFVGIDLFMLKGLGVSTADVGIYAAVQIVSTAPIFLAAGSAQTLLSALSRALRAGKIDAATKTARTTLRVPFWLLPGAAIAAGSSTQLMELLFGELFAVGGPILALLVFASLALLELIFATSIVTASGHNRRALRDVLVPLLIAIPSHLMLIPRFGGLGAAAATTGACIIAMFFGLSSVHTIWRALPPFGSVVRCCIVAACFGVVSTSWNTSGFMLLTELTVLALLSFLALFLLGEFPHTDRAAFWSLFRRSRPAD